VARAATRTGLTTRFPYFGDEGGYESFYVRAVDPDRPRSVWLRHTVLQAPGADPVGSVWATVFDAARPAPLAYKSSAPNPEPEGWLRVGPSDFEPDGVRGATPDGAASWDLTWTGGEPSLHHLPKSIMYSAPLPRTKLESPRPAVHVSGTVNVAGVTTNMDNWPGMVGHNWGAQHAERWIWLHGTLFDDRPDAWLDIALGRIRIGPLLTPWIANGVVSIGGDRLRVGGPTAHAKVQEHPTALDLRVDSHDARLRLTVHGNRSQTAVWRYSDPDGEEHHVANCSIAEVEAIVSPHDGAAVVLRTAHGGAYELGAREAPQGLPVLPFPDP
jgi:hypothetical protein